MVSTQRPRTPSAGTSPPPDKLTAIPETGKNHPPRRSSLGLLLRRTKSGELKGNKKQQALAAREAELQRQREAAAIPKSPPRLPDLYNGAAPPQPLPYGGEDRPDSVAIVSGKTSGQYPRGSIEPGRSATMTSTVPIPPIPSNGSRNGDWVDPYARTESMTHRGRYSYASSAVSTINSPRRVRRRKDPTPFNILIIGARSSGKTSFLNFLKTSLALPSKKRGARPTELHDDIFAPQGKQSGNFESHYLETEIDNERIGLTLWDSEGLEKNVVDLQLREMSSFLESKFEETFTEEMKVVRAPGVQDTHIHCAFLILDPIRLDRNIAATKTIASKGNGTNGKYSSAPRIIGSLDEDLDLQVLRTLQGKTTVVPVISKADTITTAHMAYLKKTVSDSLRKANLDPLEALGLEDLDDGPGNTSRIEEGNEDEDSDDGRKSNEGAIATPEASSTPNSKRLSSGSVRRHKRTDDDVEETPYLPLSIISPDIYEPGVIGRKFPWGFADPMNVEHCDFMRLKEAVFSEWRGELREASRELWYEGWRTSRLKHRDVGKPGPRR
ncbi:putative Septin-2A [Halenospora varia]|nr:putative Septin-2A [Halenospora varia]